MKKSFSLTFLLMTTVLVVSLIASNLFAAKVLHFWGLTLPGAVIIFPITYILNDCICEVWGYKKARLVIWLAFSLNTAIVLLGKLLCMLPAADFWTGGPHFDYLFDFVPKIIFASILAFLLGSTLNAWVMSKMKKADRGRRFGLRAIVSSLVGECADSLIFIPIAFWGIPAEKLLAMMGVQVAVKVAYEILILPVTAAVVRNVKKMENTDVIDGDISYNPFRINDI